MRNLILSICIIGFFSSGYGQLQNAYNELLKVEIQEKITTNGDVLLKGEFTNVLTGFSTRNNIDELESKWFAIANDYHPSIETVRKHLRQASQEFNVPFEILDAVAKAYNNYSMIGPSEYGSYGIMGLVQNENARQLTEASKILGVPEKEIENNYISNIRAYAALLSKYQIKQSNELIDWFNAVKKLSGLGDDNYNNMQATEYYRILNQGDKGITLWKEDATLEGVYDKQITKLVDKYDKKLKKRISASKASVDYPGAVAEFTTCNYSSRNGTSINCWVNHYIGTGTIAGALSWFKNCSANVSAHFTISRHGTIYQSVKVYNKAWHCGAYGQNNNERTIGIEHDATASNPSTWNWTSMLKPSAECAAYFCDLYGIPKTRKTYPNYGAGICGHNDMPGTSTSCPGPLPWTTWFSYLNNNGGGHTGSGTFENVWSRADMTSNVPSWFSPSSSTERGLAYYGNYLYVVSRKSGNAIRKMNIYNGNDAGTVSTSGISGGTYAINDIETTWDGQLMACNLTVNAASSAFKIYKWSSDSSTPQVYISYNSSALRLGDSFTVLGDMATRAVIYVPAANSNKVLRWVVNNGTLIGPATITLSGISSVGTCPSVAPFGKNYNEDFVINGNSITPTQFTYGGTNKGNISSSVVPTYSNSIQMLIDGSTRYLAVFQTNPNMSDANTQNVRLVNITNGLSSVTSSDVYGVSDKVGDNSNGNLTGDIAIRRVTNPENIYIFTLSTNNGIACFRPSELVDSKAFALDASDNVLNEESLSVYPNPNNGQFNILFKSNYEQDAEIQIYDLSGRTVFSTTQFIESGENIIPINIENNTDRMLIGKLKTNDKAKTFKIVIK